MQISRALLELETREICISTDRIDFEFANEPTVDCLWHWLKTYTTQNTYYGRGIYDSHTHTHSVYAVAVRGALHCKCAIGSKADLSFQF